MGFDWRKELQRVESLVQKAGIKANSPFAPEFSQRDAWELVEVAEAEGVLPVESAELLRWHMRRAFISYEQKDTPLSPGLLPQPFNPSYPVSTLPDYLDRVAEAESRVSDPPMFHAARDKRKGHYMLEGGRARARFGAAPPPEGLGGGERWPQPARTPESLQRLKEDAPPFHRRTQMKTRGRKTFDESVAASEKALKALARITRPSVDLRVGRGLRIPGDPEELIRLGMFRPEAKILVLRVGGKIIPYVRSPKLLGTQLRERFHMEFMPDRVSAQLHPKRVRELKSLKESLRARNVPKRPPGGFPHPKAVVQSTAARAWPSVYLEVGLRSNRTRTLLMDPVQVRGSKLDYFEKAVTEALRARQRGTLIWSFGPGVELSTKAELWEDESGREHLVIDSRFVPREEPDYRTFKGATITTLPELLARLARRTSSSTARSNPMANWWEDPSDFEFVDAPLGPTGALAPELQYPAARRNRGRPVRRAKRAAKGGTGLAVFNAFAAHYRELGYSAAQIRELWAIHKSGGSLKSHRAKWRSVRKAAGKGPRRAAKSTSRSAKPARKGKARRSSHPGAEKYLPARSVRSRVAKAAQRLIKKGADKKSAFRKAWAAEKR